MAPLEVNPGELSAVGDKLSGDAGALAAALAALTGGISGVNPGHDGAGVRFGTQYINSGTKVLAAGAAAISACQRMGYGVKMSAYNYALSNAMSLPGGGQPSLPIPPCPAPAQAPAMPSPFGPGIAAPALWAVVEAFVGDLWPDGDPASLRAAARAWTTYADALSHTSADVGGRKALFAAQQLPEADLMSSAIDDLGHKVGAVADQCRQVADSLTSFADKVEATQNAIRDLLNRLNPVSGGLVGLAVSLFQDGDPLATIKAIANDIKVVLSHMKDEADAAAWAFQQVMSGVDGVTDDLERWVSKEFPVVAPVVNGYIDIENGVIHSVAGAVEGIEALDPSRFLYDPSGALESWKGMSDTLGMAVPPILAYQLATNPQGVLDRVKALIDYNDWNSDHPLRGLGHNVGDIAQFFIPGVGEAKPGVTAAETSARAGEAGVGLESKLGATTHDGVGLLGRAGEVGGDIGSRAGQVAHDLDQMKAPIIEPPKPPPGPEPPSRSALPAEHPDGPAPPSQPGIPAAEVKPTAAEPAPHPPVERPAEPSPVPRAEPAPAEPVHPVASEVPRSEPPAQVHAPAQPHEAPVSERPAAHVPVEPVESPRTEAIPRTAEPAPSELVKPPHDEPPVASDPVVTPHSESAPGAHPPEHAPIPPVQAHPVEPSGVPVRPPDPAPHALSDVPTKPGAAAGGAAHTAGQAAEAAKAAPVVPSDAAGARSAPSHVKSPLTDGGAHGPTDTPVGVGDRTAPAGERAPAAAGPHEGRPGDPHVPENEHDPLTQAERDRDIADDAREPGSSNQPSDRCANGEPVDMATGEYFLPMTDIELPGVLPLVLRRQHRSHYRRGIWFGPSWTSTFDARVVVTDDGVTTIDADGTMLAFAHPSIDAPQQPRHGRNWLLFRTTGGGYRLFSQDTEHTYHFEPKHGLNGTDLGVGVLSISAITDRHQNRILFDYNDNGIPRAVTHSGGYRIDVHSDGARITGYDLASPVDGAGVAIRRFGYTGGDLATVTDGCGATTTFVYDGDHQMTAWTDSVGSHYDNVYDAEGRIASQQGTDGVWAGTFDFLSTADGLVSTFTDAYGAQTAYEFDADLRPRRVMDPDGRLTTTEFNRWRDPVAVTDPSGAVTRYDYTERGDIATITDALGAVTRYEYASPRHPNRILREGHSPVVLTYDAFGNLVEATSDGATRRFEYNRNGAVVATVDEERRRTDIVVNAAGLPTRLTDADGNTTVIQYDGFGRAVSATDPRGYRTAVTRDAEGRVLQRVAGDGTVRSWIYDGEGNCVAQTDELGATTRFEYGFYDKVTAQIAPDGARTEYRYDRARRLIEVVNPDGLIWRYTYYADGRLQSETDFNGATTTYRYDASGRLAEKTNAAGQSISYSYDALGRPVEEITGAAAGFGESGDFAGEVTRYRYGVGGELLGAANVHGAGTYSFDVGSRVRVAVWDEQLVTASFNAAGQLVGVGSPSGVRTEYGYDSRGVLSGLRAAGRVVGVGSDAAGWITRMEVGRTSVEREFDPVGRLSAQSWIASAEGRLFLGAGSAPVGRVLTGSSFGYRPDGALSVRIVDQVQTRYGLDAVGRVDAVAVGGVVAERFGYDASDNIRTAVVAGSSGGAGRWEYRGTLLVDDGRSRYSYDRAGRLVRTVSRRLNRTAQVWHYRWDAYDRLRSVTTPDGQTWTYGYDPASRRTRKTNGSTGESVVFAWLGDQLVEQTATGGVGGATTTWCYLPGAVTPLAQVHAAVESSVDVPLCLGGAPVAAGVGCGGGVWSQPEVDRAFYALVTDHLGTPTHLVDPDAATVAGRASGGLWGQTSWAGEVSTPLRFPGQYFDAETGWHYNRHRYYQPGTGRYCTADPLGLAAAPNPYGYPRNPTVETDPLGLIPCRAIALQNALRDWVNRSFTIGNIRLILDQRDLEHILTRHHLEYWDGSVKRTQTFFAGSPTTDELASIVADVLRENRAAVIEHGSINRYQINGWVDGTQYTVGIGEGHIRQLYPLEQ